MPLPTTVSDDTRRLNPHLFGPTNLVAGIVMPNTEKKRIRQDSTDGLNKTERAWLERLQTTHHEPTWKIRPHGITIKLANGVRYTPDFFLTGPELIAYEVKGRHAWDDAIVKLKVAASTHQWLKFRLASYDRGTWKVQDILP